MADQDAALSQEEEEFRNKHKAAWDEVRQFSQATHTIEEYYSESNPQYRLAPEFFRLYLNKRPSDIATRALDTAFTMWSNLKGAIGHIQEALPQISYEEDVWDKVEGGVIGAFSRDDRREEGFTLLSELEQKVVPLKSRSALLHALSKHWHEKGDDERARRGFEQVIVWNASAWHVAHSTGYAYEIENLNIGQLAPHFAQHDIDGKLIDLGRYKGRVVLLDFWASWCGPCHGEFPHLRRIAQKYQSPHTEFSIIGISLDEDRSALRVCVAKEDLHWPQICEGKCWDDPLAKLFNIQAIPQTYILDCDGRIAFKGKRDTALEEAIDSLLTKKESNVS